MAIDKSMTAQRSDADHHVIAVFQDRAKADRALDILIDAGFEPDQMSLLVTADGRGHHFKIADDKTKVPEGVGYGAVLGGLVAGLAAAAIPGSIFVAGPMAAIFAAGASGAAAGGLAGGLVGLGIAEDEAKLVEAEAGRGSIVVALHSLTDEEEDTATEILKKSGATRVH